MDFVTTLTNRIESQVSSLTGSALERRLHGALASHSTIPSHTELVAIAHQSNNPSDYDAIVRVINNNMRLPINTMNLRLLHHTLILLETLLVYGNGDIVTACRQWRDRLHELERAHIVDDSHHDTATPLRITANKCLTLIHQPELLKEERRKHGLGGVLTHSQFQPSPTPVMQYYGQTPSSSLQAAQHSRKWSMDSVDYRAPTTAGSYTPPPVHSNAGNQLNAPGGYVPPSHSPNYYTNTASSNASKNNVGITRPRAASHHVNGYHAPSFAPTSSAAYAKRPSPAQYYTPQLQPTSTITSQSAKQSNTALNDLSWMIDDRSNANVPTMASLSARVNSANGAASILTTSSSNHNNSHNDSKVIDLDFFSSPSTAAPHSSGGVAKTDGAFVPAYMKQVRFDQSLAQI